MNMSSLMSNIFIPALKERQNEITEVIKQKSSKILPLDLAQKMRTAKGFYRLEMSPPRFDEVKVLYIALLVFNQNELFIIFMVI